VRDFLSAFSYPGGRRVSPRERKLSPTDVVVLAACKCLGGPDDGPMGSLKFRTHIRISNNLPHRSGAIAGKLDTRRRPSSFCAGAHPLESRRDGEREAATGLRITRRTGHAARRGPYAVSPEVTSRVGRAAVCTGASSRDALVPAWRKPLDVHKPGFAELAAGAGLRDAAVRSVPDLASGRRIRFTSEGSPPHFRIQTPTPL